MAVYGPNAEGCLILDLGGAEGTHFWMAAVAEIMSRSMTVTDVTPVLVDVARRCGRGVSISLFIRHPIMPSLMDPPRFRPYASPHHQVTKGRYITSNDPRGYMYVLLLPLDVADHHKAPCTSTHSMASGS